MPDGDRARFQRLTSRPLDLSLPSDDRKASFRRVRAYMADLATRPRAAEGMLRVLAHDHGGELATDELAAIGHLMLPAGFRDHRPHARPGHTGPAAPPGAAPRDAGPARPRRRRRRGLLRWLTIVNAATPRVTTEAVELAGRRIEAGDMVLASLSAANRDPVSVADPEILDLTRGETGHVAFGHGVHHCLGAPLARAELRIALPALPRRFPRLRLAEPTAEVRLRPLALVHGVTALPVAW